jgi:1-deoxy-D-xylulose-5-phosphate reductoisomerase
MRKVYLLGATGSIGTQVLEVIASKMDQFRLVSISCGKNISRTLEIIEQFHPKFVSMQEEKDALEIQHRFPDIKVGFGEKGLIEAADFGTCKGIFINALVGSIGLKPTITAIERSRDVLLANKETLVVGGDLITRLAKECNVKLIPIDSEHSAIFQVLNQRSVNEVKKIVITASGGSFRSLDYNQLSNVTVKDALNHPNWKMGSKITIDSATMVNKGLEVIEAHYLFGIPYEKIETIIHHQSIIHSYVEFIDQSVIAQLGKSDMRLPIQYALTYPFRDHFTLDSSLDLTEIGSLSFQKMDFNRYPCLEMAYHAGKSGGIMPTVYNAANEAAVSLFLKEKITFIQIEEIIRQCLKETNNIQNPTLDEILYIDQKIKENVLTKYK